MIEWTTEWKLTRTRPFNLLNWLETVVFMKTFYPTTQLNINTLIRGSSKYQISSLIRSYQLQCTLLQLTEVRPIFARAESDFWYPHPLRIRLLTGFRCHFVWPVIKCFSFIEWLWFYQTFSLYFNLLILGLTKHYLRFRNGFNPQKIQTNGQQAH